MEFKIRAIKTEKQYRLYLNRVNRLMDSDPDPRSARGELLQTLVILIEDYESNLGYDFPVPNNPLLVIENRMEELGLKQKDLIPAMGDKSTVSRVLRGKEI
ncbi:MAG TPA: hypothetical protein VI583_09060 [Cyclobacteriaceae bacterium]|nr:hypothetical protein [Cyclobacteriaceae bacterium]